MRDEQELEVKAKEVEGTDRPELLEWHCQFYFIAAARRDGSAPSIEKAVEAKFFLDPDEAEMFRRTVSEDLGYNYRVFEGTAVVPRFQNRGDSNKDREDCPLV